MSSEGGQKDQEVTMVDVLQEEQEREQDANAVLGGSDDQHCTYSSGYVPRQALYLCTTCVATQGENQTPAGICLACSYKCHEGHDLVELYTKRAFRCDCGNSKFEHKCRLEPEKEAFNEKNSYNQNFKGVYCTCARPYPDPDDDVEDEMIQCIICEDWYHTRHLGEGVSVPSEFSEMICGCCMGKTPLLASYVNNTAEVVADCPLKAADAPEVKSVTTFWPDGWRSRLCKCEDCHVKYKELKIEYLCEESDMVQEYEKQGLNQPTQYEQGLQALGNMDRSQQIEVLTEYAQMKEELKSFLATFAEENKVVTEEDIKEFFDGLKARKRRRVDGSDLLA
ncbi:putative E3 ubiquitin-protein ligase UBR7 [Neocloeon triangulifer]|uniref:putative E3 ubiquitin-protein ligase UBR7 n=1 Tax=Neocloeon triangulifer TaxID=2078957 RepID=UPI00286EB738|nr:putative E3 ubiquitin-protein ligase UBR7 [Neocloeon triangulifer]